MINGGTETSRQHPCRHHVAGAAGRHWRHQRLAGRRHCHRQFRPGIRPQRQHHRLQCDLGQRRADAGGQRRPHAYGFQHIYRRDRPSMRAILPWRLSGLGAIAASSSIADNAIFDISQVGAGAFIKSLSGSGAVALGGRTLNITNGTGQVSTSVLSGLIQDGGIAGGIGGSLVISGGIQALTGDNTCADACCTIAAWLTSAASAGHAANKPTAAARSSTTVS